MTAAVTTDSYAGKLAEPTPAVPPSWRPKVLLPYLRGEITRPEPSVGLRRSDGLAMIYPGLEHAVIGEMEAGKSWFCIASAAAELVAGKTVIYVHFEETDPLDTVGRLQALDVPDQDIESRFLFIAPEQAVNGAVMAELLMDSPSLVIFDGVNEAMSLHGWGIRDEDGAAAFRRHLVKPCTAAGAATLSADHVAKDPERRGRTSLGSVHKVNGLTGVLISLENAEPFGRGRRGRSRVLVGKDRPGYLRQRGQPTKRSGMTNMGELIVDDTREVTSGLDLRFVPAEESAPAAGPGLAETVYAVISQQPGQAVSSQRNLFRAMRADGYGAKEPSVRDAVDVLVTTGRLIEVSGLRGANGYRIATAAQDQLWDVR